MSVAQDRSLFQGSWKIISVAEDSIYFNFKTDSIFIPKGVLKDIYKDGHDSLFAVQLYKDLFGDLKNYRFSFDKDSICLETGFAKPKGTYQISDSKDSVHLFLPMNAGRPPQQLRFGYTIRNNVLNLAITIDNYYRRLVLEKE